jgi:hypothetical protein
VLVVRRDIDQRSGEAAIPSLASHKMQHSVHKAVYALRRIERIFNRAKNSRRVATRYDKLIDSLAERVAHGGYDQLRHFIAAGVWDVTPVEEELLSQADRLVGGSDAVLVIDDTAIPKKGVIRWGWLHNTLQRSATPPTARP